MNSSRIIPILLLAVLISGCTRVGGDPEPTRPDPLPPTVTIADSVGLVPSATAAPTRTLEPSATASPRPTRTAAPPTATPPQPTPEERESEEEEETEEEAREREEEEEEEAREDEEREDEAREEEEAEPREEARGAANGGRPADLAIPPAPRPAGLATVADGLPACPPHTPDEHYVWHPHVDAARGCHHWHIHGANPLDPAAVAIFGDITPLIGGTTLGVPWATGQRGAGEMPYEQLEKHDGYWWAFRSGERCTARVGHDTCITDYLIQLHSVPANARANAVPVHSQAGIVRACRPDGKGGVIASSCGTLFSGAQAYYGLLFGPYHGAHVRRDSDPGAIDNWRREGTVVQLWPYSAGALVSTPARSEPLIWGGSPDIGPDGSAATRTSAFLWLDMRITNPVDYLNPDDPATPILRCDPPCAMNGSWRHLNTVEARIPREWDGGEYDEDGAVDGFITLHLYTRADGARLAPECSAPGPDCIPLVAEHWPLSNGWAINDSDETYAGVHPQAYPRVRDIGDMSPARQGTGEAWWIWPESLLPRP